MAENSLRTTSRLPLSPEPRYPAVQHTMLVKRYSNRRLYDTDDSQYITMADLSHKIRNGHDVTVIDAKTGEDLTQATLTQIVLESRGAAKLLSSTLLLRLVRLGDDALAEFLGQYMTMALDMYLHAKQGAQVMSTYNPFAAHPMDAATQFARMFLGGMPSWPTQPAPGRPSRESEELSELRRQVEELRQQVKARR